MCDCRPVACPCPDLGHRQHLTRTLSVRVTDEVGRRLDGYAASLGVPVSVVHRRLLDAATERVR